MKPGLLRNPVSACLLLEGLATGVRAATRIPVLIFYPPLTLGIVLVRVGVALAQFTSGWMLINERPAGPVFGQLTYAASALLVTVEIGLGLAPTSLFPAYRWPAVALYWLYAAAAIAALRWLGRR
jgi:xanthine/uracil permease